MRQLEAVIQEDLERVRSRLARIDDAFREREDNVEGERALEEARDLARGLESMRRRTEEARGRASGSPNRPGGLTPNAVRILS